MDGLSESLESRPLSGVWDYLERLVRLDALDVEARPSWGSQEYKHEVDELNWLEKEIDKKGSARDRLILDLYTEIMIEPTGTLPAVADFRDLSLEEFCQFRSKVEPMSEEEIRDEIRKAKEEFERKAKIIPERRYPKDGIIRV